MKYIWALNPSKLARAINIAGSNATEEQIKAEYVKLHGLLGKEEVKEEVVPVELPEEVAEKLEELKNENDNTTNTEVSESVEEVQPTDGGQDSSDDSVVTEA